MIPHRCPRTIYYSRLLGPPDEAGPAFIQITYGPGADRSEIPSVGR